MSQGEGHPGSGWLSNAECAAVLGVNASTFSNSWAKYAPEGATKKVGRNVFYHFRPLLDCYIKSKSQEASLDSEPALEGATQEIKDKWLLTQIAHKQQIIDAKAKKLLSREEVVACHDVIIAALLRSLETLQREHGDGAVSIVSEALDEAQKETERFLEEGEVDKSSD